MSEPEEEILLPIEPPPEGVELEEPDVLADDALDPKPFDPAGR